ncbi:MAG TPA: tripartite tricarboxylate transporter substrate-binding protein [candidate division Zixibacteria bacterium]|nr:tripartite tricarboxylate transporter substrate-binding protein [candidate division Zixibacteria bacterium]
MVGSVRSAIRILAVAGLVAGNPGGAVAQEFFKDKVIHFIVGYSPGGSFDLYTRVIARHFSKHVPGNPTTVVENMTGAGGIIAANHLFNRAKPDGLTIGAWAAPLVLQHIMGNEAVKFDGRKFDYLGVPSPYDTVCTFNSQSGIGSVEDWFAAKRPMKISSIGPGTSTSDIPKLLKAALNLPLEVLDGYKGGANARLAVESGEVDGYCGSWQTVETVWRSAYESGKIRAVLQATLESHPKYRHVPLAIKYAKSDLARQLITVADSAHGAQFPYSLPPGVPKDRLQILQKAFVNTLKDPEFLAEARKSKLDIEVVDGPTVAKKLASLYNLNPQTVGKLKEVLLPKK